MHTEGKKKEKYVMVRTVISGWWQQQASLVFTTWISQAAHCCLDTSATQSDSPLLLLQFEYLLFSKLNAKKVNRLDGWEFFFFVFEAVQGISYLSEVSGRGNVASTASPVGMDPLLVVQALVGVSSKVIPLGLKQVGGQDLGAVSVKEGQGRGQGGGGDARESSLGNNVSPALSGLGHGLGEEGVEQQVLELGVLGVGSLDVTQENGANNATTAPHQGNAGVVQVPAVLLGGLAHQHETLSIRDDLGSIEGLGDIVDELLLVTRELGVGAREDLGGTDTLVLDGREAAGKDSLADQGDGHAVVESRDDSPLAGSLLHSRLHKNKKEDAR